MEAAKTKINLLLIISQLSKKSYARLTVLLCLIVAIATIWMYRARYLDYRYYQYQISYESANAVSPQVSDFVKETTRLVQLYSDKHQALLRELIDTPEDEKLRDSIDKELRLYFPKMLTYTLADENGEPYWEDFDGLIGDLCQSELQAFASGSPSKPAIHPIHEGYHFDVMTKLTYRGETHILFVSFLANMLGDILRTASTPDHEIMLVLPEKNDLIEVVAGGARDIITDRSDYRLSKDETKRIQVRMPVKNTQWDVVDLIAEDVLKNYEKIIIIESLTIISVFVLTGFTLVFFLWRSDQRRESAELQRAAAQRQKDAMIAMITHEFRTPLTAIHGAIDLLQFTLENDYPRSLELQQIAARNTNRLQLLVNDFLDLKQLESSEFTLNLNQEELVTIVDESISANSTYADQFNVSIQFDRPLSPIWIVADAYRINQVISNLLSNAIKYGGENQVVDISLHKLEDKARIEIRDHGQGIPGELQANLFKSFSMLTQNKSQQKVKSSGLGLNIAKTIIEKHHGNIDLYSEPGKGTTFFFELPLAIANGLAKKKQEPDYGTPGEESQEKKSATG